MIGVVRSMPAPEVLTMSTAEDRYRHDDVVKQLFIDFHDKCYICETKPIEDPEVEHLLPHKSGTISERKFDWHNLFLSCRHCNGVKNQRRYEGRIIDCCRRDPEALIEQELIENAVHVAVLDAHDNEAAGTAELIREVFSSSHPELRSHAAKARLEALQKRMNLLCAKIDAFHRNPHDALAERSLRRMLAREAKFAGFTRCYARKHLNLFPELTRFLT